MRFAAGFFGSKSPKCIPARDGPAREIIEHQWPYMAHLRQRGQISYGKLGQILCWFQPNMLRAMS